MQPTTQSVEKLFQHERRYVVPLFQRAYVWTQDDHWQPLWEDIERQALRSLVELTAGQAVQTHHFLGAVVLSNEQIHGLDLPRANIIDGQQRLTTLQLFLAALRDYASGIDRAVAESVGRITQNPGDELSPEQRCKVWPTNVDREAFRSVIEASSVGGVRELGSPHGDTQLAKAYLYFYEQIRAFAEGEGDEDGERSEEDRRIRIRSIQHALRTSLRFVVIELEEKDDPQVIFETLNARGAPLLPSDLIRNFLFLRASSGDDETLPERLYKKYWEPFDQTLIPGTARRFWHEEERQGRYKRPRIDLFVFHYLTMQTESEIIITELFREFRRWVDEKKVDVEDVLSGLHRASGHFANLIVPSGASRLDVFARRLRSLDTSTVYPVLLFLAGLPPAALNDAQRADIVAMLESYLVRRQICGGTTKNYNRVFLGLLQALKRAKEREEDLVARTREFLLSGTGESVSWPTDAEFRRAWLEKPVYVKSRPDRAVMVLSALELASRTTKNERLALDDDLTVEHLMPQKADLELYPFSQGNGVLPDLAQEVRREKLLHTVGNLSLLTGPLNASVSNGPFDQKSVAIGGESNLRLNARFRGAPMSTWSESQIVERGEELFKLASEVWARPAV